MGTTKHEARAVVGIGAVLALSLGSATGCRSKLELDSKVDEIVGSMGACDKDRLDKVIDESLATELDQKFQRMCTTVTWFGELTERRQTGINVSPGKAKGNYDLTFANGKLVLELELTDKKITRFEFTGEDWAKARQEAARKAELEKYPDYKVYSFNFLDAQGKPNAAGNKLPPGEIGFKLDVGGLKAKDGKFKLAVTARILDSGGAKLWEAPQPREINVDQDEFKIAQSVNFTDGVSIKSQGTFQIEFDIEDRNTGKKTTHNQTVIVQ